jgi:hypothetical protein
MAGLGGAFVVASRRKPFFDIPGFEGTAAAHPGGRLPTVPAAHARGKAAGHAGRGSFSGCAGAQAGAAELWGGAKVVSRPSFRGFVAFSVSDAEPFFSIQ